MSDFNMPPGVSARDIPGQDDYEGDHQAMAVLTLRDYFAAKAMLGYMGSDYDMDPSTRAREAYRLANAMLKARDA